MTKLASRVLFAGGGTGGHVYMAIAVARELKRRDPSVEILFAGTAEGLESRIVPEQGYLLRTIRIGGLKNVGVKRLVTTILQMPGALLASLRIVREFSPSTVVGVGGFSSGPLVAAARLTGVPALLIEPNAHPGFANRLLARFCQAAAVAFDESAAWFGRKAHVTGVPIRQEFFSVETIPSPDSRLRVLIFGGSRGSHPINMAVLESLPYLAEAPLSLVHQTGPADFAAVKEAYRKHAVDAEICDYIHNMPQAFSKADVVLSRAGASTIGEITAAGKPAILIPFPQAADDHQTKNAEALARRNAAILLHQKDVTGQGLADRILDLQQNPQRLAEMSGASRTLAHPGATQKIVSLLEELAS